MIRPPRTSAFTLVELLVAIAISTILAALLASFCGSTLLFWQQQTADNERRNAAIAVFGQMRRDLRYAALPSDQPNTSLEMVINPTSSVSSSYMLPQAAFWQAPSATDRSKGENAIVGYFIQWTASSSLSSFTTPKLCRLLINPSSSDYNLNTSPWVTTALLNSDAPATSASSYIGLIADNVLGLWMQPLDQNQNVITVNAAGASFSPQVFDSRYGYQSSNSRTYNNALPASMKISIIALDSRTARHLTGTEKPTGSSDAQTYFNTLAPNIKKGAQVYSTLVNLVNAPQ